MLEVSFENEPHSPTSVSVLPAHLQCYSTQKPEETKKEAQNTRAHLVIDRLGLEGEIGRGAAY